MTTTVLVRWCATCRAEEMFEQPECLDGHGDDCPELLCVACGNAVLVGLCPADPAPLFHASADVA
jgi:hypothetical protein